MVKCPYRAHLLKRGWDSENRKLNRFSSAIELPEDAFYDLCRKEVLALSGCLVGYTLG